MTANFMTGCQAEAGGGGGIKRDLLIQEALKRKDLSPGRCGSVGCNIVLGPQARFWSRHVQEVQEGSQLMFLSSLSLSLSPFFLPALSLKQ